MVVKTTLPPFFISFFLTFGPMNGIQDIFTIFWCFFSFISFMSNEDEPKQFNFLEITVTNNCTGQYDFKIYHQNTITIIQLE